MKNLIIVLMLLVGASVQAEVTCSIKGNGVVVTDTSNKRTHTFFPRSGPTDKLLSKCNTKLLMTACTHITLTSEQLVKFGEPGYGGYHYTSLGKERDRLTGPTLEEPQMYFNKKSCDYHRLNLVVKLIRNK